MEIINWLIGHWFDLAQTIAGCGSVLFAGFAMRKETKARKVGNGIATTGQFIYLRGMVFDHPELLRVDDAIADLKTNPISEAERVYAGMRINHLSTVFRATKEGEFVNLEGLRADAKSLISLPIPQAVWEKIKTVQNEDFVQFIEGL